MELSTVPAIREAPVTVNVQLFNYFFFQLHPISRGTQRHTLPPHQSEEILKILIPLVGIEPTTYVYSHSRLHHDWPQFYFHDHIHILKLLKKM